MLTAAVQKKRIYRKIFLSSSLGGYLLKIESITMSKTSHAKVRSRLSFLLDYYEERTTHRDFSMNSLPPTDAFQLHDIPKRFLDDSRNMLDQNKYILYNHIAFNLFLMNLAIFPCLYKNLFLYGIFYNYYILLLHYYNLR